MTDLERAQWWERKYREKETESNYYQQQLVDAHAILGRVVHQLSERWGSVNLTEYFPTDNLHHKRGVGNAAGARAEAEKMEAR